MNMKTSLSTSSLIRISTDIRSMGGYDDIHTLMGTVPLKTKEYSPDYVHGNGVGEDDDDYTPDYVGDGWIKGDENGSGETETTYEAEGQNEDRSGIPHKWKLSITLAPEDNEKVSSGYGTTSGTSGKDDNACANSKHYHALSFQITSVSDNSNTRMIQHPIEDGTIINDNKVNDPIKVTVNGFVCRDASSRANKIFEVARESKNLKTYMVLETEMKSYPKLYMTNFSKRADTQKLDVYEYTLQLQELFIDTSNTDVCKNAGYASSENKGGQGV